MSAADGARNAATWAGEQLWHLYSYRDPADLVLEDLSLARKVLVTEDRLDRMDARLIRKGHRGIVRVKRDIPEPARKRFAIAHELGHWELHGDRSQVFACTDDDMIASYKSSAIEGEANCFAAGLLMPGWLFEQRRDGLALSVAVISDLKTYFETSFTATAIRYVELSSDPCAVVVCAGGRIRWWRGSDEFVQRFWLETGSKLLPTTVAGRVSAGEAPPTGPDEVDIGAWSEKGADDSLDGVFLEECLTMERYRQTLCLLRMP